MSKKPHTVVLLDESGSMMGVAASVVSTFYEFTQKIKDTAKSVSLYTFDSLGVREQFYKAKLDNVPDFEYRPNSCTPLYDSIAYVIDKFKDSKRPVQMVIHTDGFENDSIEYSFEAIKSKIDAKVAEGWLFIYLGEGLTGKAAMQQFTGVKMNFTGNAGRHVAMGSLAQTTTLYSQSGVNDVSMYTGSDTDEINIED